MKINWTVRIKNKNFWLTLVPATILLIQSVAAMLGFTLDLGDIGNKIVEVINAIFTVLTIFGVVNDPTTATLSDSTNAMTYTEPKKG